MYRTVCGLMPEPEVLYSGCVGCAGVCRWGVRRRAAAASPVGGVAEDEPQSTSATDVRAAGLQDSACSRPRAKPRARACLTLEHGSSASNRAFSRYIVGATIRCCHVYSYLRLCPRCPCPWAVLSSCRLLSPLSSPLRVPPLSGSHARRHPCPRHRTATRDAAARAPTSVHSSGRRSEPAGYES